MSSFSVLVTVNDLEPCDGVVSFFEGDYLASAGGVTDFVVLDNQDGSFLVTGAIIGQPCGASSNRCSRNGPLITVSFASVMPALYPFILMPCI